jgi:hypothetical protein
VHQTRFGSEGNCFSACVASIMDLPIDDVPNFENSGSGSWFVCASEWLAARGHHLVQLFPGQEFTGYHIGCGLSPRGYRHSVVYRAGEPVHDPHPDGAGLEAPDSFFAITKVHHAE